MLGMLKMWQKYVYFYELDGTNAGQYTVFKIKFAIFLLHYNYTNILFVQS